MEEARAYETLRKYVLPQGNDDLPRDTTGLFDCYRCGQTYTGLTGQCSFHHGSFVVQVPATCIGLVIGKGGVTIKKIADKSGARLDISHQGTGSRFKQLFISGGADVVERATRIVEVVVQGRARLQPGQWSCCTGGVGAGTCVTKQGHVRDSNHVDERAVVDTQEKEQSGRVFALDCEMVKTARGGELARVTVLNFSGAVCFDTLVLPPVPIGDYKTSYSGLTPTVLDGVTTRLKDVQDTLVKMIAAKDIIIGHSLIDDMNALHLKHKRVVDTISVFPHPDGPPKKMSLKNLSKMHLKRVIQEKEEGHDSMEDALAALDLMKSKIA